MSQINALEAIAMMNNSFLIENLAKNDRSLQTKSNADRYINMVELSNQAPIDLSRRRDSVETRKTPSPYTSSISPSPLNESPNSLSSNFGANLANKRSDTPTNRYQSAAYHRSNFSSSSRDSTRFPYETERTQSPLESMALHPQFMREHSISGKEDEINSYILNAVAFQQKLQTIQANVSKSGDLTSDSMQNPMQYPMVVGRDGKLARPFKAYPRDPISLSGTIPLLDSITDRKSAERFSDFRQKMLQNIHEVNDGAPIGTNPKMRRISQKNNGEDGLPDIEYLQTQANSQSDSSSSGPTSGKELTIKDTAYFERRRKNNAAAKKSRDRRRIKEDEIAIRAAFLERENFELKIELESVRRQLASFLNK